MLSAKMDRHIRSISTAKQSEHKAEVQSGHFMVSEIDDSDSESEEEKSVYDDSAMDSNQAFHPSGKNAVSEDLSSLFKYLKIAYSGKITCPRWNTFRSLRIHRRSVIRLNNYIWRGYHMQFINHIPPKLVNFDSPSVDRKQHEIVADSDCYKHFFEARRREYVLWRLFAVQHYRGLKSKAWTTLIDKLIGPSTFIYYRKDDLLNSRMQNTLGDCTFSPSTLDEIMMDFEENFDIFLDQQNDLMQSSFVPVQPMDPLHEDISAWNSHFSSAFTFQAPKKRILSDQSIHSSLKGIVYESPKLETLPTTVIASSHQPFTTTETFNSSESRSSALPLVQKDILRNECRFTDGTLSSSAQVDHANNHFFKHKIIDQPQIPVTASGVTSVNQTADNPSLHLQTQASSSVFGQCCYDDRKLNKFAATQNKPQFISPRREGSILRRDTKKRETKGPNLAAENNRNTAPLLSSVLTTPMLPVVGNLYQVMLNHPTSMPQSFSRFVQSEELVNSISATKRTQSTVTNTPGYSTDSESVRGVNTMKKSSHISDRAAWSVLPNTKQNISFAQPPPTGQLFPVAPNELGSVHGLKSAPVNDFTGDSCIRRHHLNMEPLLVPTSRVEKPVPTFRYDRAPDTITYSSQVNESGSMAEWCDVPATHLVQHQQQPQNMFTREDIGQFNEISAQQFDTPQFRYGALTSQTSEIPDGQARFGPVVTAYQRTNLKTFHLPSEGKASQGPSRQRNNSERQCSGTFYPTVTRYADSATGYTDNTNAFLKWNSTIQPSDEVQKSPQSVNTRMLRVAPSASAEFDNVGQVGLPGLSGVSMDVQQPRATGSFAYRGRCSSTNNLFAIPRKDISDDFVPSRHLFCVGSEKNVPDGVAAKQPPSTVYSSSENISSTDALPKQLLPSQNLVKQPHLPTASDTSFQLSHSSPSVTSSDQKSELSASKETGDHPGEPCHSPALSSEGWRNLSNSACLQILRDLMRIHRTLDRSTGAGRDSRPAKRSGQISTGAYAPVATPKSLLQPILMRPTATTTVGGSSGDGLLPAEENIYLPGGELVGTQLGRRSRAATLHYAADYIAQLQDDCDATESLCKRRRAQIANLISSINSMFDKCSTPASTVANTASNSSLTDLTSVLQRPSASSPSQHQQPPGSGSVITSAPATAGLCSQLPEPARGWFQAYVRRRTEVNWKFYVFSLVVEPLFHSYWTSVNMASKEHFVRSLFGWLYQHCSLAQLRPAAMNAMCKLCVNTSILTDPSRLPSEGRQSVRDLFKSGESCSMEKSIDLTVT